MAETIKSFLRLSSELDTFRVGPFEFIDVVVRASVLFLPYLSRRVE